MNYTPTAEDLAYILASDGERFTAHERHLLESEIGKVFQRRSDNGASNLEGSVMGTWADRWVEQGGNDGQALTKSPIPPEPDDDDGILDPDFAAACVECRSNEPCCLVSGSVSDSTDSTRKITWPPAMIEAEDQCTFATTLLVVAKEMEGMHLLSKVQVEWEGQRCRAGHYDRPRMDTIGLTNGRSRIEEQQVEVATGYQQALNTSLALRNYVPENVLYALFAMDAILAIASAVKGGEGASFTPFQCLSDASMGVPCRVIPLPYAKLDGKLELATRIGFSTAGVSGSAEAKGTLTGQYGSYELTAEGSAGGSANTGQAVDSGSEAPGLVGTMARIIGTMDHYVSVGNRQRQELDRTQFASGIQISKSLTFEPKGFELTAVTGTPNLQLSISSLASTLSIGVSGKLDFIDALAFAYSGGPGARAIQEARRRMAAGENVTGTLDAYLEMAATGSLSHTIDSGASITIPANGNLEAAYAGIQQQFGGELKISGKAEIAIEVEAQMWVFSAKAGASGSLHTAWIWAMRMHEGKRQRSYEFEGVVLTLTAYAEVKVDNDADNNIRQKGFNVGEELSTEVQVGDLFKRVGEHIGSSQTAAEDMAKERSGTPQEGTDYPIWSPEVPQWQDY